MGAHRVSGKLAKWGKSAILAVLGLMVTGCLIMSAQSTKESEPKMKDLKGIKELKTLFNADKGSPRLVLLFSPT